MLFLYLSFALGEKHEIIIPSTSTIDINVSANHVVVPLNPKDFWGEHQNYPILGNTGFYILNFTESSSFRVTNPYDTQTFTYYLFKLNDYCNYIDIYINPPS